MTEQMFPPPDADAEALSAYLAGELGDAESRELERRLAAEPQLAAQLDALADALVALGGFDAVEVPAGFDERLEARLARERGAPPSAVGAPIDLAARRRKRQGAWLGIGTAAAVVALGAVMFSGVLRDGLAGGGGAEEAALESAGRDMAGSESAAEGGDTELYGGGGAATGAGAATGPVVRNRQVAVADEQALRRRFSARAEAQELLGVPVEEAAALQKRYTASLRELTLERSSVRAPLKQEPVESSADDGGAEGSAPPPEENQDTAVSGGGSGPNSSGAAPPPPARSVVPGADRCLATIMRGQAPLVPVRVESLRYEGRPVIAYLFVTVSRGSGELDRTELWVVRPRTCATVVFQQY